MCESNFLERVVPDSVEDALWQEHINRYSFVTCFVPKRIVLDVACGTGYGTELLSIYADLIVGVDISRNALTFAKKHYSKKTNTNFVLADAIRLPFRDDIFDIVVSFETIEHLIHFDNFLQEIKYSLKMQGKLIISTPNGKIHSSVKHGKPSNPFHFREFSRSEFSKLLKGFSAKMQFYGQCPYNLKDWAIPIVGSYSPKFLKGFLRKLGGTNLYLPKPETVYTKTPNLSYSVKKIRDLYPIRSSRFFVVVVNNEKK